MRAAAGPSRAESEIDAELWMEFVDVRPYTWPWRLSVDELLALLRTTPQHAVADVSVHEALLAPRVMSWATRWCSAGGPG